MVPFYTPSFSVASCAYFFCYLSLSQLTILATSLFLRTFLTIHGSYLWNPSFHCSRTTLFQSLLTFFSYSFHHHHHHVVPLARISLTLSRHFSLSFIAFDRSSGVHPVSSQSCCMYVRAGCPAFAWLYAGVHSSTSLMSSSLLLVRLTCIVFVMGGRWTYSWCLVGVLPPGIVHYCSQHSNVIAV